MPNILIIGENGQLARVLRSLDWPGGCRLAFHGHRSLGNDIDAARLRDLARGEGAHLILNAAAYTAVDRAEGEPELAAKLNADLPHALAVACRERDIPLVHVSTDYVFDGEKGSPYVETDSPNPLSVYGATKLAGERHVAASAGAAWCILRTSWLFSEIGETFPVKILRRAMNGETLRVVTDQRGCPTPAIELARAMQMVGLRLLDGDRAAVGLFHFCGPSAMSWHEFARLLLAAAAPAGLKVPPAEPISSDQIKMAARRPRNSVLSCELIERRCSIVHPAIGKEIERVARAIVAR